MMNGYDHDHDEEFEAPDLPRGQMSDPAVIKTYLLAGRATVTIVSKATGTRFTYEVNRGKDPNTGEPSGIYFVSLLTDPDNERGFKYFGHIFVKSGDFVHGKKARITEDASGVRAWRWFYNQVIKMRQTPDEAKLEVWHEGRCAKCGRKLTVPESVERGIGPECWARMGGE
jgi:hypothetical protein